MSKEVKLAGVPATLEKKEKEFVSQRFAGRIPFRGNLLMFRSETSLPLAEIPGLDTAEDRQGEGCRP